MRSQRAPFQISSRPQRGAQVAPFHSSSGAHSSTHPAAVAIFPGGHAGSGGGVVGTVGMVTVPVDVAVDVVVGIVVVPVVVGAVVGAVVVAVGAVLSTQREVPPTVRSILPFGQSQRAVRGFGRPPAPQEKFSAPSALSESDATTGAATSKRADVADRTRTRRV